MRSRETWLNTRTAELRAALLDLGVTIADSEARVLINDKLDEYARLMRVTRQTAQRNFTDEHLAIFANSLAMTISEEAPGANMIEFERKILMPTNALGLTNAALAEALKVAHSNLEDRSLTDGLSNLSTLGMITADTQDFLVPVPRPLLLRIARFLDNSAKAVSEGANLPDGVDETTRSHFVTTLRRDADGLRTIANIEDGAVPKLWRTPNPP
ncbi:hypothetical protein [Rhodococcus sp. T9N]|jgi:hypothetical protein|uniref:hypothetical protein n=1 Tax=Rhodococcus sp. T9N TaxID=627445 RepID=UPI0021C4494A|nr:hypothetical protein [Rhodococcus sp. T9N]